MKRKFVGFLGVFFLMFSLFFANPGYAKVLKKKIDATFGAYLIKVNGKSQSTETLYYNSKVYIPITELPKLTAAKVSKSGSAYNVIPVNKEDGITQKNIDDLKIKVNFLNFYNQLNNYYDGINLLCNFLDYSYSDIRDNNSVDELNSTIDKYNRNLNILNGLQTDFEALVKSSAVKGYNTKNDEKIIGEILDDYNTSLNYLYQSIDDLNSYSQTKDESKVNSYQNNSSQAFNMAIDASNKAWGKYTDYLSQINKQ